LKLHSGLASQGIDSVVEIEGEGNKAVYSFKKEEAKPGLKVH
jgi:hypothetical protein